MYKGEIWIGQRWRRVLRECKITSITDQYVEVEWLFDAGRSAIVAATFPCGMLQIDTVRPAPEKPAPWKVGQRRRGGILDLGGYPREPPSTEYTVIEPRSGGGYDWRVMTTKGVSWSAKESWPSELLADAPTVEASPSKSSNSSPANPAVAAPCSSCLEYSYACLCCRTGNSPEIPDSSPAPVVAVKPTGPIACTATGCDRLREIGPYANRAGLCADHVAEKTRECRGLLVVEPYSRQALWADGIMRGMRLDVPREPRIDGDW